MQLCQNGLYKTRYFLIGSKYDLNGYNKRMTRIPGEKEVKALHEKYAPNTDAYDRIFTHCLIVWDIAKQIIEDKQLDIDVELVKAGCLIHDIGAYSLFSDGWFDENMYITHGIVGYELLKKEGYGEQLCRIASHHTGVGLSRIDIEQQQLPLPDEDFLAETTEEALVMYADKFHSKHPRFNSYEGYKKTVSKFGDDKLRRFEELAYQFGIPNMQILANKYDQPLI